MKITRVLPAAFGIFLMATNAHASIFATELVASSASLDGSGWYNNPNDLLGKPTTTIPGWPSGTSKVSIVEPAWGGNAITTFNEGDWAIVKFDDQVRNDPGNPFGLDFIVYGNAFFAGSGGLVDESTDHTEFSIGGGVFAEPLQISVSQDLFHWYTYENGPYGDDFYPTNPWVWDYDLWMNEENGWTDTENDYAKPVNPNLTADDFAGSSYEAMLLYDGSAGGAGFDLEESGLDWIQYVRVAGVSGFSGGEIDAFSDVAANPVPVPGAVWLLGSGLLGLIGIRRRRKSL